MIKGKIETLLHEEKNPHHLPPAKGSLGFRINVITNRLKANLIEVEPGESRVRKILYYSKLKSKVMFKLVRSILRNLYIMSERWPITIVRHYKGEIETVYSSYPYDIWMAKNFAKEGQLLSYKRTIKELKYLPTFAIILPLENKSIDLIQSTIDSIQKQIYSNWSLVCISGKETTSEANKHIQHLIVINPNIKLILTTDIASSAYAKNEALATLEVSNSNYLCLIKVGDQLLPDSLFQYLKVLNNNDALIDMVYADDDCINENEIHFDPRFKPKWNKDSFLSQNFIGNAIAIRTSLIKEAKGWNEKFESAQDYELLLRLTIGKQVTIEHLPKVLYSVLVSKDIDNSVLGASDYIRNSCLSIEHALLENGEEAHVKPVESGTGFVVRYKLKEEPKVSIIIPTKDKVEVLEKCIHSIFTESTYRNFEIILIDNNSSEDVFFQKLKEWKKDEPNRFKSVRTEAPFNFSFLMNLGVSHSTGDFFILLNNDTEVITSDWIERMLEQAQRKSIGVVGVKLLYPNNTIQHAGVVVGLGGGAGHLFIGKSPNEIVYMNYLNIITNYSALTAACIMVRKELYEQVNGFDELLAVEFNDVDFCLRIKEMGFDNVYLPHVELYHYESISRGHPLASKISYERHLKELGLLKTRWSNYIENDPCYSPNLSKSNENMTIKI